MRRDKILTVSTLLVLVFLLCPISSRAWHDETHIAIAKVAGYHKWFNATGTDMAKLKAGDIERHNHYVNNSPDTKVTPEMVLDQSRKYNQIDKSGHSKALAPTWLSALSVGAGTAASAGTSCY